MILLWNGNRLRNSELLEANELELPTSGDSAHARCFERAYVGDDPSQVLGSRLGTGHTAAENRIETVHIFHLPEGYTEPRSYNQIRYLSKRYTCH